MKRILTFKPWQLFLLIVIAGAWTSPGPLKEIINSISVITYTIWLYSIGVYGQKKVVSLGLPTSDLKLFKINILLLPILLISILVFAPEHTAEDTQLEYDPRSIFFIPFVLYLFFAIFQTLNFTSKTLATVELRRKVNFGDYFTNLILFGILVVGVWIVQPKVMRLIGDNDAIT